MIEKQPRIALLIDADNSPASKIDVILAEHSSRCIGYQLSNVLSTNWPL